MSYQKKPRHNEMNTTVFLLLFCVLTTHCAIYRIQDEKLSRIVRSPHFTKSDSGDSSLVFRTQNWSGVARGADGAQGVFSGAAAAAGSAVPAADEAISIAASGAAPVNDKLEQRFGGSHHYANFNPHNFYNPYIPDHRGSGHWAHVGHIHDFHGYQRRGYDYGQLNSGANRQAFAKSEASSNFASGCDNEAHNGLGESGQPNIDELSKSPAYSQSTGEFGNTKQNSGQFSSNTFSKSQATNTYLKRDQKIDGYGSGLYTNEGQLNGASNDYIQTTAEFKPFNHSEPLNGVIQQANSSGNGFSNFQDLEQNRGQELEHHGKGFSNSQSSQNNGDQRAESYGSGFSSSQGFQNTDGHKVINQGFGSDPIQKGYNHGFNHKSDNSYGSRLSQEFVLGTGSTNGNAQSNYNRQAISSNSESRTFGEGFTGHRQKYAYGRGGGWPDNYQTGFQSKDFQEGGTSGGSLDYNKSLLNNANSKDQENLSSNSGSSGNGDLQSTLSGALDLASQGLKASENQPCSTCQKGSYAFSNAKSHSGSAIALSIGG